MTALQPAGQRWVVVAALCFAAAALLLPLVGPAPLDWSNLWHRNEPDWSILVHFRLTRTLLALFAGGALALGGTIFQAMLRDALATPDTLGVSAGASLGAVAAMAGGWHLHAGMAGIWGGALGGAALVLVGVVGAASSRGELTSHRLLLAGLATNSACWALILVIHSFSGMAQSYAISRWLIGSLDAVDFAPLAVLGTVTAATSFALVRRARHWTLLSVGDVWAGSRGVDVHRLLRFGYVGGSVLSAATVAITGPVGFVSLVVPHLVRLRISADDRILMPCAFLFGGVLLASCDALGRWVIAPAEVPVGAITALIGAPYLIWQLRRRA
jgi:iron complex transport system permease protein